MDTTAITVRLHLCKSNVLCLENRNKTIKMLSLAKPLFNLGEIEMKCLLIVFKNLPLKIINLLPVLLNSDELNI